jgi:hypothetical protein
MVAVARPPSRATLAEATDTLRRLLDAVEAGELDATDPRTVALVRRLQGVLVGWEAALGRPATGPEVDDPT